MDKIIYDSEIYYIKKGIVYDRSFLQVPSNIAKFVYEEKYKNINYETFEEEQLLDFIKEIKNAEIYDKCIKAIEFGLKQFVGKISFYRVVFPILSSCYRAIKKPENVIDFWMENRYIHSDAVSSAFLTSVAGAYCDMGDYKTALTLADRAYAKQGGASEYNELSNVYARIKKALGDKNPK